MLQLHVRTILGLLQSLFCCLSLLGLGPLGVSLMLYYCRYWVGGGGGGGEIYSVLDCPTFVFLKIHIDATVYLFNSFSSGISTDILKDIL